MLKLSFSRSCSEVIVGEIDGEMEFGDGDATRGCGEGGL